MTSLITIFGRELLQLLDESRSPGVIHGGHVLEPADQQCIPILVKPPGKGDITALQASHSQILRGCLE